MEHTLTGHGIVDEIRDALERLDALPLEGKVRALNQIRLAVHEVSPFHQEPVDCVLWVPQDNVEANDYNPNVVAAPEMELLEKSIEADGYTQPIVTWEEDEGKYEVVDGFHRNLVARRSDVVGTRVKGYLPVTVANADRTDRGDRMASTIRHNRARGTHQVDEMSEIVRELVDRNWSDKRIAKELGMEPDEVLRLKQITGLARMFKDREFSEAWAVDQS